jgi:hypothetical protein
MIQRKSSPVKGRVERLEAVGAADPVLGVEDVGVLVSLLGGLEDVEGPVPFEGVVFTGGVWL